MKHILLVVVSIAYHGRNLNSALVYIIF